MLAPVLLVRSIFKLSFDGPRKSPLSFTTVSGDMCGLSLVPIMVMMIIINITAVVVVNGVTVIHSLLCRLFIF